MFYQNNALKEIYIVKTIEELNASKVPIVIIDKSLDKLDEVVLFRKRLKRQTKLLPKLDFRANQSTAANKTIMNIASTKKPKILA